MSMNSDSANTPLLMVRPDLERLPVFALPPGFAIRWYQPGDEQVWHRLHVAAEKFLPITTALFREQFGSDPELLAKRQCYLLNPTGVEIGTAAAWFNDEFDGRPYGRVHWAAIVPEFQGRGLSKPLMSTVCLRLRELGHNRAYLATSAARRPALRLYRRFGFVPLIRTEAEAAAWATADA